MSALGFVRDLRKQQTLMFYILASDEPVQATPLGSAPQKTVEQVCGKSKLAFRFLRK